MKYIPQSDVTILDSIWTTAYVTRNHGCMIFDTLYGIDNEYQARPRMVEGHSIENAGKLWKLTLRDGLKWHDGEPVLARDCVASIERWGKRDRFGQTLLALTDELSDDDDDKTIGFRLKRPFAQLPDAPGKPGGNLCAMMPERLAKTDPFKPITEMVGSGPFKWNAAERAVGALAVYERNAAWQPRTGDATQWTAGPKVAHFDRVEWHVIPDESTKANALITGEVDWWENPTSGMLKQIGMTVDYQAMDWGTLVQRRAMMEPPDKGGWNLFITGWSGLDQANPVGHVFLRGKGKNAMFGWPDSPRIDAPDQAEQKKLAVTLQLQAFTDVPYIPLGQYFAATAYRKDITGILSGFVKFWNVRRS